MPDIIYRFDEDRALLLPAPQSAAEAMAQLEQGNRDFSTLLDPATWHAPGIARIIPCDPTDVGHGRHPDSAPEHAPFAAVLGCSDARVPTEFIFNQGCNDLFVVRVAGNVLGSECLGSIDYAIEHLGHSLKLLVVLGHSGCGAVTAAVDAFLDPSRYLAVACSHPLRAVVDRILVAVRAASKSLDDVWGHLVVDRPGYRSALIESAVSLNAALAGAALRQEFCERLHARIEVVYGVYDMASRQVRVPGTAATSDGDDVRLAPPPQQLSELTDLGRSLAESDEIREWLA